ncbi:hypothetical protein C5E06_09535 [Pseudoclavibacter sp. RFBI5]|uniref:helix-turn-helix domain-containing protein n=1 Tax=Pseudoclavibacter sp. RFBI5 TaxID=2080578 RepID=UPI000CE8F748|nr:helix-turn-helix domain-containing protein [Pseudoclavibacter sp. RFBI5]PPG02685.1 hypothetical protein C5E06_09535 [Pseudoclavibacter sp. RFBI5]
MSSIQQAFGYARIRVDSEADLVEFGSSLVSSHVKILERDMSVPTSFSALAGPRFCAAHTVWPKTKIKIDRSLYLASHRRLFIFVNKGQVNVSVGTNTYTLTSGQVSAQSVAARELTLEMVEDTNEVLLLSVDVPAIEDASSIQPNEVRFLRDPGVNALTYAASYGLSKAPLPQSKEAATTMYTGAATIARMLLLHAQAEAPLTSYEAAMRYIRLHASDDSLTATGTAEALGVSERSLQHAFQANGDSPSRAIRRTRVQLAEAFIHENPDRDLDDVARLAGLRTARRLREARTAIGRTETPVAAARV